MSVKYTYNSAERLFAAGVSCKAKDFDTSKGRVKSADPHAGIKNAKIAALTARIERAAKTSFTNHGHYDADDVAWWLAEHERIDKELQEVVIPELTQKVTSDIEKVRARIAALEAELAEEKTNLRWLLLGIPGETEAGPIDYFTDRITEFTARRGVLLKPATRHNYTSLIKLVTAFNSRLDITEVNLKVLNSFQTWLVEKKRYKNQSVNNYVTKFKAILKEFADELNMNLAYFSKFKPLPDLANENIIILGAEEIQEIENLDVSKYKVMAAVQDQFVFCHETGLRHSDIKKVGRGAIEDMPEGDGRLVGQKLLRIQTKKGSRQILVPLTPKALAIMERNNHSFHNYTVSSYNQALTSICRRCKTLAHDFTRTHYVGNEEVQEVKPKAEFVQSHAARRTFINNALFRGVSESTCATWVGHSDVKMIQQHYRQREAQALAEAHKIL